MDTIATAALAGFGVILILHIVNGGDVPGTTEAPWRLWLTYVFTGVGPYSAAGYTVVNGGASTDAQMVRV